MTMADAGKLTTHVLDTATGRPGSGLRIDLRRLDEGSGGGEVLKSVTTNADGRCDAPLLQGDELRPGVYELVFHVGDYFRAAGLGPPERAFLDAVPVRFGVARADQHYHVPLLVSPYGYATYRGS
jgi:5-hydroxyisourate hydrolase